MMRGELRHGADLAEYAEAVGVPTSQVIAVTMQGGAAVVIYTPAPLPADDPDGVDTTAWLAKLHRDGDRILRHVEPPAPSPYSVHDLCVALLGTVSK